jgi:hypothetical protein
MANKHPPPARNDLERLYDTLLSSDEEMDEATAAEVLREHGVDLSILTSNFRLRLEQEARRLRAQGVPLPFPMLAALEGVRCTTAVTTDETSFVEPSVWIDALLADSLRGNASTLNEARYPTILPRPNREHALR